MALRPPLDAVKARGYSCDMINIHSITDKGAAMGHNSGDEGEQHNSNVVDIKTAKKARIPKEVRVEREKQITMSLGPEQRDPATTARLKSFIERVERLEEEKAAIADDIKDIYGEAKSTGFDTKTIRKLVRIRKMRLELYREEQMTLDLYACAIGLDLEGGAKH